MRARNLDIDAHIPLQEKATCPGAFREHQKKKVGQTSAFSAASTGQQFFSVLSR